MNAELHYLYRPATSNVSALKRNGFRATRLLFHGSNSSHGVALEIVAFFHPSSLAHHPFQRTSSRVSANDSNDSIQRSSETADTEVVSIHHSSEQRRRNELASIGKKEKRRTNVFSLSVFRVYNSRRGTHWHSFPRCFHVSHFQVSLCSMPVNEIKITYWSIITWYLHALHLTIRNRDTTPRGIPHRTIRFPLISSSLRSTSIHSRSHSQSTDPILFPNVSS